MEFRTPAGLPFDVPDDILWSATAPPPRAIGDAVAYEATTSAHFETRCVPLCEVEPPQRYGDVVRFRAERARHILIGMASGDPLPPVIVVAMPTGTYLYRVRDGFHRFHLSIVCGFSHLPVAIDPWNEAWMWEARA